MIEISLNVLSVLFELLIYYFFFHYFFEKPRFSPAVMALCYLLAGAISLYLSVVIPAGAIHRWGYLVIPVALAICYQGQFFVQVFISFVFQEISMMIEKSYVMILMPMQTALEVYGASGFYFYYLTGVVLSNLTILLLVRFLCSWKDYVFIKKKTIIIPSYFWLLFLFPLCIMFVIDQYTWAISQIGIINAWTVLPILVLTAITVGFFFLFDGILHAMQNEQLLKLSHKQLEQEQQYHAVLLDKHQQFQKLRHDMKDNFNNIAGLIKNGHCQQALEFAQQQSGQLALTAVVQTGSPMLDTILTLKEDQARKQGIELQCHIIGTLALQEIDSDDLASLCSNLLNNAIEAAAQVANPRSGKFGASWRNTKDIYI